MSTVWPGLTTFAAAWMVQNGSASLPWPTSLQLGALTLTYKVDDCVLVAARAAGVAARPTARSDTVIPASQAELRT
jgi:beta-phosphoglucomutase-like phosphatase (HAD superfamily)